MSASARANEELANATNRLAEVSEQLEDERSSRIAIEAQLLGPISRKINHLDFIKAMSEFSGVQVDIQSFGRSILVDGVARMLHVGLGTSGWSATWWHELEGSAHLSVRIVTARGTDEKTQRAAYAVLNFLASPELRCHGIPNAGGTLVDFAKDVVMPNGQARPASENAQIGILVGGAAREFWVRPAGDRQDEMPKS